MKYELQVLINNKAATRYIEPSSFQTWIEGRKKSNYKLRLKNNTNRRAEFVVSVDGLSIIDGTPAGTSSKGYIVGAYSIIDIDGWLLNDETAAKFEFSDADKSYVAKTDGATKNIGVIGLRVFEELYISPFKSIEPRRVSPLTPTPQWPTSFPKPTWENSFPNESDIYLSSYNMSDSYSGDVVAAAASPSLGTAFGDKVDFKTSKVQFTRASEKHTYEDIVMYGDATHLNKIGIVLDWQKKPETEKPNAFPGDTYCNPPKDWRG